MTDDTKRALWKLMGTLQVRVTIQREEGRQTWEYVVLERGKCECGLDDCGCGYCDKSDKCTCWIKTAQCGGFLTSDPEHNGMMEHAEGDNRLLAAFRWHVLPF